MTAERWEIARLHDQIYDLRDVIRELEKRIENLEKNKKITEDWKETGSKPV